MKPDFVRNITAKLENLRTHLHEASERHGLCGKDSREGGEAHNVTEKHDHIRMSLCDELLPTLQPSQTEGCWPRL